MLTEFDDGVIPAQAAPEVTLIKDDDNDGVFDSAATMSHAAYVANAEYGDPSKWTPFWKLP